MNDTQQDITELEFSEKYADRYALRYFKKHEHGFWRRLSIAAKLDLIPYYTMWHTYVLKVR